MERAIRTAVVPAAGFGTRMAPATNAVPKELLPVGRRPAIEWVLDEGRDAGIDRFVVVSSPHKPQIENYLLSRHGAIAGIGGAERRRGGRCRDRIEIVYQTEPLGLGDAVRVACSALGSEPFALLLPDELLLGGARLLRAMLADFAATGQSGISLLEVERAAIGSYGCAAVGPSNSADERLSVTACIEKPNPSAAPSCFALSGRYVLGPDVLGLLGEVEPDERGEVQLTDALGRAAKTSGLAGFPVRDEDGRVDVGNWRGWFDANARLFESDDAVGEALVGAASGR